MSVRLASLILEGFKSFATRVELTFPGQIVAIVGPNGAGKSNLSDAIAWVLGEQSARLLRSQTMGDVIFAGSAQRAPAGAAQVTLVLQSANGQGDQPLEITRRVLRDGTSEYRLQGKRVRLKDVMDKLAEAGLGTRAYAIIEQGRIAQVLSAKPADRRALFEEAAGISHFRLRRQEAELKLAETRANLERVADIEGEVKRELASLRRQAKHAQRHAQLSAELKSLSRLLAALRLAQLDGERARTEKAMAQAAEIKARTAAALARAQAEAAQAQRQWEEGADQLRRLEQALGQALASCQRLEAEEAACRRELESLRDQEAKARRSLEVVEGKLEEERAQEQAVAARLASAREERERLADVTRQAEGKARALEQQAQEAERVAEQARSQLLRQVGAAAEARNRYHRLQVEQEQLRYQQQRVASERERLTNHLAQVAEEEQQACTAEQTLQQQLLAARQEEGQRRQLLEQLQAEAAAAVTRRDQLEHSLWQVKHEREGVQRAMAQLRAVPEALQRLLPERLLAGAVGDYLNPPKELATLLDAAYGELLSLPVVAGEEAVEALVAGPQPDGLLEVAVRQPNLEPRDTRLLAEAGVDPQEQGWLSRVLPPVAVVTKGVDAAQLAQDPACLLLLPGGVLRQGQRLRMRGKPRGLLGLLQLKQKEQELQAQEEQLQREREEVAQLAARLAARLSEQEGELARARAQQQELAEKLAQVSSRHEARHRERLRLEREMEALELEAAQLAEAEAKVAVELEKAGAEAKLLEERARAASSHVDEKAAVAGAARRQAAEARSEAARGRAAFLVASERYEQLERELSRHRKQQQELMAQRSALQQELARLRQRQEATSRQLASVRLQLEQALQQTAELRQTNAQLQQQVASLKQALETKQQEAAHWHQEDRQAQEALHAYHVRLAELGAQRAPLAASLEALPPAELPELSALPELEARYQELQRQLASLGPVNELAMVQEQELSQRYAFLREQRKDLERSLASLQASLRELDETCRQKFLTTLEEANRSFGEIFRQLFGGGHAEVVLADPESPLDSVVEVRVRPPGKHTQSVLLLSGGEKALAAVALLLALFRIRPAPFCVLDEVDAPLDDINVERFCQHLKAQASATQFLLITHNRRTMAYADVLYGVTMEEPGVSRVVSVRLEDA